MPTLFRAAWQIFQARTQYSPFRTDNNGLIIGALTLTCALYYIENKRMTEDEAKLQSKVCGFEERLRLLEHQLALVSRKKDD
jgi:hypothetical protein